MGKDTSTLGIETLKFRQKFRQIVRGSKNHQPFMLEPQEK